MIGMREVAAGSLERKDSSDPGTILISNKLNESAAALFLFQQPAIAIDGRQLNSSKNYFITDYICTC
jgi:hypothetical protein